MADLLRRAIDATVAYELPEDRLIELIGELENFVKEGFTELLLRKTVGPRSGYTGQK